MSDMLITKPQQDYEHFQQLQHFVELGRLSASLLHEISNPLTAALLSLEQSKEQNSLEIRQARRSLQQIRRYVEAARNQVQAEASHSRFCTYPQLLQLRQLVRPLAKRAGVDLSFNNLIHCQVFGDPVKFQQILANLILNAIDAYANDSYSSLRRSVRVNCAHTGKSLVITVVDWGEGIRPEQLPMLFEPFYTTKSRATGSHGLGIGLSIVRQYITEDFHGSVSVRSSSRAGTRFIIKLPATEVGPNHLKAKNLV